LSFISLVTPAADRSSLSATIDSAINSSDPDWETVIVLSENDENRQVVEEFVSIDSRIRSLVLSEAFPSSGAFEKVINEIHGDFLLLTKPGDRLGIGAIESLKQAQSESPADLIYGDENLFSPTGELLARHNKSAWSPERLRSHFFVGRFVAVRTEAAKRAINMGALVETNSWYDLTLRVSEGAQFITHIPKAEYNSTVTEDEYDSASREFRAPVIDHQTLENHLDRLGLTNRAQLIRELKTGSFGAKLDHELISVVIPTTGTVRRLWGNNAVLIEQCVAALLQYSSYRALEITVIADVSTSPDVLERLDESPQVRVVEYDRNFNYSETINIGSRYSNGDLMLCLDDDVIPIDPRWIENLSYFFEEHDVAIVGPTLLNEDFTIQSAGKFFHRGQHDAGWARSRRLLESSDKFAYPAERSAVDFSAVLLRLSLFEQLGGLDVDIPTSGAGIDYCSKVASSKNRIIWTPQSRVVHLKESSRPQPVSESDLHRLRSRWGSRIREADKYLRLVDLELAGLTVYDRYESWIREQPFLGEVKRPALRSNFTPAPVHPKLSQSEPPRDS